MTIAREVMPIGPVWSGPHGIDEPEARLFAGRTHGGFMRGACVGAAIESLGAS